MTRTDLKRLAGLVAAMWPGQPSWPDATIEVAAPLFANVDYADAEMAVADLVRSRDYMPPPGIVLGCADDIAERRSAGQPYDPNVLALAPGDTPCSPERWAWFQQEVDRLCGAKRLRPGE